MIRALGIDVGASGVRAAIVGATKVVVAFGVALPARGTGTGGARFARIVSKSSNVGVDHNLEGRRRAWRKFRQGGRRNGWNCRLWPPRRPCRDNDPRG
jgi:hypothetical protein